MSHPRVNSVGAQGVERDRGRTERIFQKILDNVAAVSPGETKRLLVVEDDLASCFALRALFERRSWQVSFARSVAEALGALSLDPPDWLILDLFLPDGDGEEVLRWVREAGLNVRVAVTSGILDSQRAVSLRKWKPDILM